MPPLPVTGNPDVSVYGTLGLRASQEVPMMNHLRLRACPVVATTARYLQRPADRIERKHLAPPLHERAPCRDFLAEPAVLQNRWNADLLARRGYRGGAGSRRRTAAVVIRNCPAKPTARRPPLLGSARLARPREISLPTHRFESDAAGGHAGVDRLRLWESNRGRAAWKCAYWRRMNR